MARSRLSNNVVWLSLYFAFLSYWAHSLQKDRDLHLAGQDDPQVVLTYAVFIAHRHRGKDKIILIA